MVTLIMITLSSFHYNFKATEKCNCNDVRCSIEYLNFVSDIFLDKSVVVVVDVVIVEQVFDVVYFDDVVVSDVFDDVVVIYNVVFRERTFVDVVSVDVQNVE